MGASILEKAAPSDSEIERAVVEVVGSLAPDKGVDVTADATLIDGLGYDSAQMIELGLALERRLGCQLKQTQLGATTVADLVGIVRAAFHPESVPSATPVPAPHAFSAERAARDTGGVSPGAAQPGDSIGDFDLVDVQGNSTTLSSVLGGRTAVVVLYRGGWCPYCNIALRNYQSDLVPALDGSGVALIAISPQMPDASLSVKEKNDLSFTVLSDPGNRVAEALGVQIPATHAEQAAQRAMRFDLHGTNADGTAHLPRPTVAVVAGSGVIRWIDISPDYAARTKVVDIVAAVKSLT